MAALEIVEEAEEEKAHNIQIYVIKTRLMLWLMPELKWKPRWQSSILAFLNFQLNVR